MLWSVIAGIVVGTSITLLWKGYKPLLGEKRKSPVGKN